MKITSKNIHIKNHSDNTTNICPIINVWDYKDVKVYKCLQGEKIKYYFYRSVYEYGLVDLFNDFALLTCSAGTEYHHHHLCDSTLPGIISMYMPDDVSFTWYRRTYDDRSYVQSISIIPKTNFYSPKNRRVYSVSNFLSNKDNIFGGKRIKEKVSLADIFECNLLDLENSHLVVIIDEDYKLK